MADNIQQQIDDLRKAINDMGGAIPEHLHNGYDVSKIKYLDLDQKKLWVYHTIQGTAAATAGNYAVFFIVPMACVITSIREVHQVLGTDGSAVTLNIEKLTGTQALDGGATALATAFNLKSTINTVVTGTLSATLANRTLAMGNRLAMKDTGTLTAVANVTVLLELTII